MTAAFFVMVYIRLLLVTLIISSYQSAFTQSLSRSQKGLEISFEDFRSSLLNGLLPIDSLYNPDKDFLCLSKLGKPRMIVKTEHVGIGEELEYKYSTGLLIFYTAMSQPNLEIGGVEISDRAYLQFPDGHKLQVGGDLRKLTSEIDFSKPNDNISIHVKRVDVTRINLKLDKGIIQSITIYF
jgi:hypothetical protein